MATTTATTSRARRTRRWAMIGFVLGAAVTVPATVLALTWPAFEAVHPHLLPGPRLLQPLVADRVATWPGAVNVVLAAVANGAAYALVAGAAAAVLGARGGPGSRTSRR